MATKKFIQLGERRQSKNGRWLISKNEQYSFEEMRDILRPLHTEDMKKPTWFDKMFKTSYYIEYVSEIAFRDGLAKGNQRVLFIMDTLIDEDVKGKGSPKNR